MVQAHILTAIMQMPHMTARKRDGEYRVAIALGAMCEAHPKATRRDVLELIEASAYYTTDADDAHDTARAMSLHHEAGLSVQRAMRRTYRDARAIHVRSLARWRASLRTTQGNPMIDIGMMFPGPVEVKREAVEAGIQAARHALVQARRTYRGA